MTDDTTGENCFPSEATEHLTSEKQLLLDDKQREAVELGVSVDRRLVAITGPAGTGKTTIMRRIHNVLTKAGYEVVACAPTGKAAKRIKEATGIEAVTIHRLLEYPLPDELFDSRGRKTIPGIPKKGLNDRLLCDVVLCDEYAMVNSELHRNLLNAMKIGGLLRVFGDINQLQPIEEDRNARTQPSPFAQTLTKFPSVYLDTIHRQGEGSGITRNGSAILNGRYPVSTSDFILKITDRPVDAIIELVMTGRENGIDYGTTNHQIITPSRNTWIGTYKMNGTIQSLLHPEDETQWMDLPRHKWDKRDSLKVCIGDKIIWTQNCYPLAVFNGESGIITDINHEIGTVLIDFGDRVVEVPPAIEVAGRYGTIFIDPRRDIELGYVITTHKSQGSEWKHVTYLINKSVSGMLERSNFYTAITRAREHVNVVTDQRALNIAVLRTTKMMDDKK